MNDYCMLCGHVYNEDYEYKLEQRIAELEAAIKSALEFLFVDEVERAYSVLQTSLPDNQTNNRSTFDTVSS